MAAADAPAGGDVDDLPYPYETVVARAVFEKNRRSVVRLHVTVIKDGKESGHCGTGFIVFSNARHMLIMTCGHSLAYWDDETYVIATFHDAVEADADVVFLMKERELALLEVDYISSKAPGLSDAARYPPVALSEADPRKGDFLVMLGYPTSVAGHHPEMGTFHGSVTNETTNINDLQLFSADYPTGPGASGAPVFGVFGEDDHRVVGLCKGGQKSVAYTLPVSWIRDTLKTAEYLPPGLGNATIPEILQLFSGGRLLAQRTGDPGGSGAASPSSSTAG